MMGNSMQKHFFFLFSTFVRFSERCIERTSLGGPAWYFSLGGHPPGRPPRCPSDVPGEALHLVVIYLIVHPDVVGMSRQVLVERYDDHGSRTYCQCDSQGKAWMMASVTARAKLGGHPPRHPSNVPTARIPALQLSTAVACCCLVLYLFNLHFDLQIT